MERDVVQHGAAAIVAEADVREFNVAAHIIQQRGSLRVPIFRTLPQNLARALKTSESLGKLSANRDHLHDGRNQEAQEQRVRKESADGQCASHNLARADIHDYRANHSEQQAGGKTHDRGRGKRAHDVIQQTPRSRGEHRLFTFFRVVALDHAHAAERFCQPSGYLGVDFAALAKNWADRSKSFLQRRPKQSKKVKAITVISGLMRNSTTIAMPDVMRPPASSTSPVPSRLRTPSTSLIIRDTSVPVLLES